MGETHGDLYGRGLDPEGVQRPCFRTFQITSALTGSNKKPESRRAHVNLCADLLPHSVFHQGQRASSGSKSPKRSFQVHLGIVRNRQSHLYRINGTEDHLHILSSLHPTCCLADFVKDIKIASSRWIKEDHIFPGFTNWQEGYGAFTHSLKEKDALVEYIKGQEDHHKQKSFRYEFRALLLEAGVEFEERYLL